MTGINMEKSTPRIKYALFVMMVFSIIIFGCSLGDPIQKTTDYLNAGNISEGVQYYNEHIEKADDQTREEIDNLISDYIDSLIVDWDVSDETTEKAIGQLTAFTSINNQSLSNASKEKLDL
jgi:hypothetical protein